LFLCGKSRQSAPRDEFERYAQATVDVLAASTDCTCYKYIFVLAASSTTALKCSLSLTIYINESRALFSR
jgi:hypothetical protein